MLTGIGQLILALSILVVLHELGHFIPAKLFGMRVDKFYLFFNWKFSLIKFRKGETEYGIGWIPLGGYVKIAGMIDESMDKDQMKLPPQPWEFRSKPAWQRLIVMLGGVFVNIILGIIFFSGIYYVWGEKFIPSDNLEYGIYADSLARDIGFQHGDKLLGVNGENFSQEKSWHEVSLKLLVDDISYVDVERNGNKTEIIIPSDFKDRILDQEEVSLFGEAFPFVIDSVSRDTAFLKKGAYAAGIKKGDNVLKIGKDSVLSFLHARDLLSQYKEESTPILVEREGERITINTYVNKNGHIGVIPAGPSDFLDIKVKDDFTVGESINKGFNRAFSMFGLVGKNVKLMTTNIKAAKKVRSVFSMVSMFGTVWDWQRFWGLTAFLSMMLAFMNLLPIPGLDGGHALFTIYEIVLRRKPSQKFMEISQSVGMILLLSLMAYAVGNDIISWIR